MVATECVHVTIEIEPHSSSVHVSQWVLLPGQSNECKCVRKRKKRKFEKGRREVVGWWWCVVCLSPRGSSECEASYLQQLRDTMVSSEGPHVETVVIQQSHQLHLFNTEQLEMLKDIRTL